jgi:hypothetical protein
VTFGNLAAARLALMERLARLPDDLVFYTQITVHPALLSVVLHDGGRFRSLSAQ